MQNIGKLLFNIRFQLKQSFLKHKTTANWKNSSNVLQLKTGHYGWLRIKHKRKIQILTYTTKHKCDACFFSQKGNKHLTLSHILSN